MSVVILISYHYGILIFLWYQTHPQKWLVTLVGLLVNFLLKPHSIPYCGSKVMTREIGTHRFPLYWMSDLKVINKFDFVYITPGEQELVPEWTNFKFMSFRTLITLDQRDDSKTNEYLGELVVGKNVFLKVVLSISPTHFFLKFH